MRKHAALSIYPPHSTHGAVISERAWSHIFRTAVQVSLSASRHEVRERTGSSPPA